MLYGVASNERNSQGDVAAFRDALAKLGWIEGRNLSIEIRYGAGDANRIQAFASELVKLAPEVILATSQAAARAAQEQTRTIPIVGAGMASQGDPANALIKNIARPEGNITGFPGYFTSVAGKWAELLKEAAPNLTRIAVFPHPNDVGSGYGAVIEAAAPTLGIAVTGIPFRSAPELDRAIPAFAAEPNGGLIIVPNAVTATRGSRQSVLLLATRYKLPVIHWNRSYPDDGGLMSYGSDLTDQHRRAAEYVDRLLRGAKISDLPVQYPTKFDLVINLKAANAIGLTVPATLRARADETIE
jgi:putative ABC transport system substrate-binding protein